MAITYKYADKCGTATFESSYNGNVSTYDTSVYEGNCFLIFVREYTKDGNNYEELNSFFFDKNHMRRCLEDGIFTRSYNKLVSISINIAKCSNWCKAVELLTEYVEGIKINLYKEGEQNWSKYEYDVPDSRVREIAEDAISYMYDNDILEEFLDDRCLELTDKEKEYFFIDEFDEENEEEGDE